MHLVLNVKNDTHAIVNYDYQLDWEILRILIIHDSYVSVFVKTFKKWLICVISSHCRWPDQNENVMPIICGPEE